ncbi:LemA family protein [Marinigracilibium pacificum]|uniref:LemA family protein n=1 Tax=Marinigracilibium pacificum TaxID=2729599 RepID=A0A848J667_9BACT|nr:LemA family protein [Marinigracilibium pacificum]NMM50010.1 LemA family protein [Marinigracilibium pacificum]
MKKGLIIFLAIAAVVVLIGYNFFAGNYNKMVTSQEVVEKQWAQVETQYQRRADLIPNLVNTVKGYADFERETLTQVIEARAKATSVNIDASNLNAETMAQFQAAQGELNGALSRLLVAVERYPDLKANQNFLELQAQLEGTENRIQVARDRYNDTVRDHNSLIKTFPRNMLAGMYGFDAYPYFEADEGSEKAPEVKF